MLTDRGKLLLIATVGLWLLGRSFGLDEVSMAAVACLVLVVLALLYTRLASARLNAHRHVDPDRLWFDAQGAVTLELRNDGRLPTALLVVEDQTPPALADPPRVVLGPLGAREAVRVGYPITGRQRGRFTIRPARVLLRDPIGVAQRPVRVGTSDEVIVYPPVWPLPSVLPRVGRLGTATDAVARPRATSGEFVNVRDYVRGDDLRKVHWKSTARRGKLMLRQEEAPLEVEATIVLDTGRSAHRGSGPTSTFEHAVAAAASAAHHLAQRGYRLRLVTDPGGKPPTSLSWQLALERLAVIEPLPATTLAPVWQELTTGSIGEGLLVAVIGVPEVADLRGMVRAGGRFAARAAIIVAPAAPVVGRRGGAPDPTTAITALRGAGWRATVTRPGSLLAEAWRDLGVRPLPSAAGRGGPRAEIG